MSDEFRDDGRPRRRRRHHRRRDRSREREREVEPAPDVETPLPPEEIAYREAQRLAERKVRLTGETIRFAVVVVLLLIFLPIAGVIVLLCWGPGLGRRFYRAVLEPKLRERFVREEVEKQVHAGLSQERQLLEGAHARSMEELSASIAHEIRNPITAAKSLVQQMEEDPAASENVEYARVALEELRRVERSVSHLLRFARDEEMSISEVRLSEILDSALETFRDRLSRSGIELERRIDGEGLMRGDAEKLRRVVINLVGNAIDALMESGTVGPRIQVQMGENLAGTEVWLRVADNGPGIDPASAQKLFSPFYTSKANGTGLGLAISRKLVDAHGGSIEIDADAAGGASFVLSFPKSGPREGGSA